MKNRIKELREKNGYSLEDVSNETGIPKSSLSEYEKGLRRPRKQETWVKLANCFETDVTYLMGLSDIDSTILQKPDPKEVGSRIKLIRQHKNLTMEQFGKLVGDTPKGTVNNWEKGNNLPNKSRLESIAILGNVSVSFLKWGELEKPNFRKDSLTEDLIVENMLLKKTIEDYKIEIEDLRNRLYQVQQLANLESRC